MSNVIYIDVPNRYNYNFSLHKKSAEVLRISENIHGRVEFVCNSLALISEGDVYKITFDQLFGDDDKLFFILKHNFDIIDSAKVEEYILRNSSKRKYTIGD